MTGRADLRELTPNQIVAYSLRLARTRRGWTQDEAAERLEPYLGERWSKVNVSAVERSAIGGRARRFDADDLVAFALCFELPPVWFLLPPAETRYIRPARRSTKSLRVGEFIDLLVASGWDSIDQRITELPPGERGERHEQGAETATRHVREALGDLADLELQFRELTALADNLTCRFGRAQAEVADRIRREEGRTP
jgi:transcriptional regulator with XRE-family HTH domain